MEQKKIDELDTNLDKKIILVNGATFLKLTYKEPDEYAINTFDDLVKYDKRMKHILKKEKKTIRKLHKNKK